MSEKRREWSIVMTEFTGIFWDLFEATKEVFGREGFDASGPAVYPDRYLPAEIADGLTHEKAISAAERFKTAGATMIVVKSIDLPPVRHRAREYWSQVQVGDYLFTEIDGLITLMNPTLTRDRLYRGEFQNQPAWRVESFFNHMHTNMLASIDDAIQEGQEMAAELESALKQAYPDRAFTVSHWFGNCVSFWQTSSDSPREAEDEQKLTFINPSIN